jgi:hypothetical protein
MRAVTDGKMTASRTRNELTAIAPFLDVNQLVPLPPSPLGLAGNAATGLEFLTQL